MGTGTRNPDEVVVAAEGDLYVAPVGTAAPATILVAPSATWLKLGYTTTDGVTFLDGKTLEPIRAWQEFYPIRNIVTEKVASLAFVLMQWNKDTVPLAFGGGAVVEDAPGAFSYEPPAPSVMDERAAILEWQDGAKDYRLIVARVMVSENVETNLVRTAEAGLPITLSVLGETGVAPWLLQTNDPAFDPGP